MGSGHVMWAYAHVTTSFAYHNKHWHAGFHIIEINSHNTCFGIMTFSLSQKRFISVTSMAYNGCDARNMLTRGPLRDVLNFCQNLYSKCPNLTLLITLSGMRSKYYFDYLVLASPPWSGSIWFLCDCFLTMVIWLRYFTQGTLGTFLLFKNKTPKFLKIPVSPLKK